MQKIKKLWNTNKTKNIKQVKSLGNTFTHPVISQKCIQFVTNKPKYILEPAVGTGSFYYAVQNTIKNYAKYDIYDIDKNAIDMIEVDRKTNKFCEDFLLKKINTKYDLIVTNPPYISYKNMKKPREKYIINILDSINFDNLKVTREKIQTVYSKANIYMYFYLKCLSLLRDNGELIFLCSDSWLNSDFGKILKKELLGNVELIVNSPYYPFFKEKTNAILVKVIKNKIIKTIKYYEINQIDFKIENPNIITSDILQRKEKNLTNILYNHDETKDYFNYLNSDKIVELSSMIEFKGNGVYFRKANEEGYISKEAKKDYIKLFYQDRAKPNRPKKYKNNMQETDMIYYINKFQKEVIKTTNTIFMSKLIDRFPLIFSYTQEVVKTKKYFSSVHREIDNLDLNVILLSNIFTIFGMEVYLKTATQRSDTKNMHGSVKEISLNILHKIPVPNFKKFQHKTVEKLLENYQKYKNISLDTIDIALANPNYYENQILILEELDISKNLINSCKTLVHKRLRDLKLLGLELVDREERSLFET